MIMYNRNNYQSAKEDVIFILNRKEDVDVKTKALIDNNFEEQKSLTKSVRLTFIFKNCC